MNLRKVHKYRAEYFITSIEGEKVRRERGGYPITINGHVFFIGHVRDNDNTGWRVTDRNTGLWIVKNLPSFKAAVNEAVKRIKEEGEDKYCRLIAKLIKEKAILMHPNLLSQRYSDYMPVLEITICKEAEDK